MTPGRRLPVASVLSATALLVACVTGIAMPHSEVILVGALAATVAPRAGR